jgi:hypothetical protein
VKEIDMSHKLGESLRDGTLVRHKEKGYQGKIEGTTSIKACFTRGGESLQTSVTKETFQYRISIAGESIRQIAPLEDLEVLDAAEEIGCVACHERFYTKPGLVRMPSGRCACGGWICPLCMSCQTQEAAQNKKTVCPYQRKRFLKLANSKKTLGAIGVQRGR